MEYLKTNYRFSMYRKKKIRKSAKRLQNSAARRQFPNIEYDKQQEYRFGIYKKLPGIKGNGNRYGYQRRLSSSEELGVHISAVSEYNRQGHQQYKAEYLQIDDKGDKPSQTNKVDKRPDTIDNKPDDTSEHKNINKKGIDNDSGNSGHVKEESNDDWRPKDIDPPSCQEMGQSPDGKFRVVEMDKIPREYDKENDTVSKFKWEGGKKKRPMIVCYEWDHAKRHDQKHFMRSKISGKLEDTPPDWNDKGRPFVPRIYGVLNQRRTNRKYNVEARPHNHGSLDMSSDLHGYRYRGYANNNAFHPGRYFRANASLPNRRWPAGLGGATKEYLSNENVSMRPKVLTIVRHGTRPRNTVKIFLNRRSIQSFEQVMGDISEAFGPKWKNSRVRKLYTLKGREVQGISDFFRHDDVFVACSNESINEEDFRDIMQEMFPDSHYAKNRHRDFERSRRKRHQPVQKEADNDKRDSGFGEASEGSNSNRESDQEATHAGQVQGHGHGRPEEKRRRERKDKDKRSLSPAKDSHREEVSESPREPPKDMFGKGVMDDRERARKRQQKMMESEKRALEDERRKRGLVPLKAQDDPFKKMKEREKEKLEVRRKREQEKKRQQEEEEKERKRKEFEEAEKAARARKAAAEKEEREKEEREKAEREKEERIKAEKEKEQEKAKDKDKDSETNKEKDKDKNGEKEKVKEKDNKESEKPHSKKRQKTKIVRRTKAERQISNDEPVLSKYDLGRTLGDGNFAIVRTSKLKASGQEFAMKVIDKPKLKGKEHMVENEIEIMKDCSHHNIVKLYEEYETPDKLYLVMELVKGGDLFDAITQSVKFGEVDSANMVKDLCNALFYLHSRSIVHRDLKPENLLVHRNKDGSITLKLADFGLAMEVKELIYTVCGTPTYVAPEILSEIGYGLEVDMWAVGVISYILLCGFPPFRSPDRNQTELFEFIKAGAYEFLSPYWDYISNAAKDMIQHLLVVEKKRRYTAIEVLSHPWIIGGGDMSLLMDSARIDESRRERRKELEVQAKQNLESYTRMKEKRKAKEE